MKSQLAVGLLVGFLGVLRGPRQARTQAPAEHEVRGAILRHLADNECASISELCRELDLSWGVAQHHLYVLRRAGLVYSETHGRTNRVYTKDQKPSRARILALLRSPRARDIVRAVSENPGVRQKELLERLQLSRKVFRHHVDLLVSAGLVTETKGGANRIYQPTELSKRGPEALLENALRSTGPTQPQAP